jgi:hypothetical protein
VLEYISLNRRMSVLLSVLFVLFEGKNKLFCSIMKVLLQWNTNEGNL